MYNLSSPPEVSPVDHKNETLASHYQSVRAGKYGKFLGQFAKVNILYVWYTIAYKSLLGQI